MVSQRNVTSGGISLKKDLTGLSTINVELTSRCNKNCWMCGRRKVDRDYPDLALSYGDMDFELLGIIAKQLPEGIVVQFHRDGEALLYPRLGEALRLFPNNIRNIVTNGKLLLEKADELVDSIETLSISIFQGDAEAEEQREIIEKFLVIKGERKPFVTLRLIGEVNAEPYEKFDQLFVHRVLHEPMGSFGYVKRTPTIPEIGICWDYLHHPCVNYQGDFSICVRFDPERTGVLGNVRTATLGDMWFGERRSEWSALHIAGKRNEIPLCAKCEYWGVPISP
jgi:MoaA/NifB/PqqE/SkfB family radical SAM enzyme